MNPQEQHEYDVAIQNGHQHFYQHIPLYKPQILDLLNAIKKKKPDLVVVSGVLARGTYVGNTQLCMYRGLNLAYANLPNEIVGYIGFDGENYLVNSRLIENAKYSAWNSQDHHTKKSKHMNNIVKEAVKYLLPTQFSEVVEESANLIARSIHSIRSKAADGLSGKLRFISQITWRDELLHMAKVGYTPENSHITDAIKYIVETQEEYDRNANYNPAKTLIWIKPDCVMYGGENGDFKEVKSVDELSEDIRGKLVVLMVGDEKRFIDEIGMKIADNKFWVLA